MNCSTGAAATSACVDETTPPRPPSDATTGRIPLSGRGVGRCPSPQRKCSARQSCDPCATRCADQPRLRPEVPPRGVGNGRRGAVHGATSRDCLPSTANSVTSSRATSGLEEGTSDEEKHATRRASSLCSCPTLHELRQTLVSPINPIEPYESRRGGGPEQPRSSSHLLARNALQNKFRKGLYRSD